MNDLRAIIKEAGLKITKARIGVLEYLSTQTSPSDVLEIHTALIAKGVPADQATVYRILENFIDKDIVKTVNFEDKRLRYELSDHHHHHLVCVNCKRIESIDECSLDEMENRIKQTHQFQVQKHNLEFFGYCKDCNR